jgi:hypothetical protein
VAAVINLLLLCTKLPSLGVSGGIQTLDLRTVSLGSHHCANRAEPPFTLTCISTLDFKFVILCKNSTWFASQGQNALTYYVKAPVTLPKKL